MSGWLGLDWGTVPDWVGALVTGSAAAVAAISYRGSVKAQQREQASKVAAWVALDRHGKQTVYVANRSDASVYELTVSPAKNTPLSIWELPAGRTAQARLPVEVTETKQVTVEVTALVASVVATSSSQRITATPRLTFRDALGRGWLVDGDGRLRRSSVWTSTSRTGKVSASLPFLGVEATVEAPDGDG